MMITNCQLRRIKNSLEKNLRNPSYKKFKFYLFCLSKIRVNTNITFKSFSDKIYIEDPNSRYNSLLAKTTRKVLTIPFPLKVKIFFPSGRDRAKYVFKYGPYEI